MNDFWMAWSMILRYPDARRYPTVQKLARLDSRWWLIPAWLIVRCL